MTSIFEKKLNKIIIGAVLGTAILGVGGLGMTPKGKSFLKRLLTKVGSLSSFFIKGFSEFKKTIKK